MSLKKLLIIIFIFSFNILISANVFADNQNINEIIKTIQKDIKTLEKAVYSETVEVNNETFSSSSLNDNSEDVLTKHLLNSQKLKINFNNLQINLRR